MDPIGYVNNLCESMADFKRVFFIPPDTLTSYADLQQLWCRLVTMSDKKLWEDLQNNVAGFSELALLVCAVLCVLFFQRWLDFFKRSCGQSNPAYMFFGHFGRKKVRKRNIVYLVLQKVAKVPSMKIKFS